MKYNPTYLFFLLLVGWGPVMAQEKAFLGIEYDLPSRAKLKALQIEETNGSYVTRVLGNSSAEKAGLLPMDYLFGIDDLRTGEGRSLGELLSNYRTGDRATLHFYRKGKPTSSRMEFLPRSGTFRREVEEEAFLGVSPRSGRSDDELGTSVTVVRNSTAQMMGIRNGDVILSLNGFPIVDWNDISLAMSMFRPGQTITVAIEREGQKRTLKAVLLTEEEREALSHCEDCGKKKAYLGFYSEQLSSDKAARLGLKNPYGAYVSRVIPGTAADEAGIQPFDYIYGVDEYRTGKEQNLGQILSKYYAGEQAKLHLVRQSKNLTLPVTFGQRTENTVIRDLDPCQKPFLGVQQSYAYNTEGVQVNIVPNSTAEALGLENGDVITGINGNPIIDWNDITIALSTLRAGDPIAVEWQHEGRPESATLPIKSTCETKGSSRGYSRVEPRPEAKPEVRVYSDSRATLKGYRTRLSSLSTNEARELNEKLDLQLATTNRLDIDQFSLLANGGVGKHRLQFNLPSRGRTTLRLFNQKGRIVYAYDLGDFAGDFSDTIDIVANGPGTYYLEIRQDKLGSVYRIEVE